MDSDRRQPGFALLLRWSGFLDTKNCKVYPVYKNPDIIEGKESWISTTGRQTAKVTTRDTTFWDMTPIAYKLKRSYSQSTRIISRVNINKLLGRNPGSHLVTRTSGHDGIDVGHLWKCLELVIAPIMHKTIVWNISYRYIMSCGWWTTIMYVCICILSRWPEFLILCAEPSCKQN